MICPLNANVYKICYSEMCGWWCEEKGCCAILALAKERVAQHGKTNCLMCENYGGHGKCKMAAAVCESNDMKECCKYYQEREQ